MSPTIGSTSDIRGLSSASNVKITNLDMPIAGTEYNLAMQNAVKMIEFRARNNSILKFSFVAAESGTKYFTVPKWNTYGTGMIEFSSKNLYVQASDDNEVLEVIEYY